ncbi:Bacteriophage SPP1, head-tail adaptor [uncultured Caudovirales phage]|uniref:Bacteriophage SPP1, head-tail adaptor n=1 Tax=uncultured Caudovirales phage TaxID=2100421 RepID=A0A6J5M0K7_9CAUD|nr:Bacteriophage SPP1, head-tail adaptor [uncultured Caudovirales phage]
MIGTLRHKLTVLHYDTAQDGNGEWVTTPVSLWSGWGAVERINASRTLQAQQVQLQQEYEFRIRSQSIPLYQNTVIVWNNYEFTVSEIENEGERDRFILITGTCVRKVPTNTVPVINNTLMLIAEFKVQAGAAMQPGGTVYTNANIPNVASPIVFIDGIRIPYLTGNGRDMDYNSITKTITINGGVQENEIVAIYA